MEKVAISDNKEDYQNTFNKNNSIKYVLAKKMNIKIFSFLSVNLIILIFLITRNISNKKEIIELKKMMKLLNKSIKSIETVRLKNISSENLLSKEIQQEKNIQINQIDKDMIGLTYPEISFEKIKNNLMNNEYKSSLIKFLEELEVKLIFLEKEINATKINTFYTSRTLLLQKRNIEYDDANITELHNIVSWLIIHRSTQLKGIVSDKYLACKYVQKKLGINLCPQRIGVYNSIDEIDFNQLIKMGNVILKISNGNHDNIYIYNNTKYDIIKLKKEVEKAYYRNFPLIDKVFSHSYSKKRIVLEKMFLPITDLFEFKFVIVNNNIIIIYVRMTYKNNLKVFYYDANYNNLLKIKKDIFDITSIDQTILDKLKYYALKLSEDFPNFIRIDLYLFHEKIYLSELTFDHQEGKPSLLRNNKIIRDAAKNWKRIDCDL